MPAQIHGRLFAAALSNGHSTVAGGYTVPASRKATVNISLCNITAAPIVVRLAHIDGAIAALADEDYLEYGFSLPANGVLERTGITMRATHTLIASALALGVSVMVTGIEEDV